MYSKYISGYLGLLKVRWGTIVLLLQVSHVVTLALEMEVYVTEYQKRCFYFDMNEKD